MSKAGIIQSRGLGDILIALPIARELARDYSEVLWPICEEFWPSVKDTAAWVHWIPLPTDKAGHFFYHEPIKRLRALGVKEDDILCLYQSLNVIPELSQVPWFQIQHFDEFKYSKAGVPFLRKWTLRELIERDLAREQALYDRLVKADNYYVTQFKGSNFTASPDLGHIPPDWQRIDVDEHITDSIFDWLTIIERSQALICIDSALSNMVDQMKITSTDKYWIPRSHIHLTPVLGTAWTILEPPPGSMAAQQVFRSSPG